MGLAGASNLDPLKKMQKRNVRIITRSPLRAYASPLSQTLSFLKINDILEIAEKMYSMKNNREMHSIKFTKTALVHHYSTRHAMKHNYFITRKRTEIGKKFLAYLRPKIWQDVPNEFLT